MANEDRVFLQVLATITDPFDGLIRMLGDAQRFGLGLEGVELEPKRDGRWAASLRLFVPVGTDGDSLRDRLARHPSVLRVAVAQASEPRNAPSRLTPRNLRRVAFALGSQAYHSFRPKSRLTSVPCGHILPGTSEG